jgi:hypothetical protein
MDEEKTFFPFIELTLTTSLKLSGKVENFSALLTTHPCQFFAFLFMSVSRMEM